MKKRAPSAQIPLPPTILDAYVSWVQLNLSNLIYLPCLLCGSSNYEGLASIVLNRTEFFIVRCIFCGLIWRNPLPDSKFLNDLYSVEYYNVATHSPNLVYQVGIADSTQADQLRRRKIIQREVASWIGKGIQPKEGKHRSKLLEIGGGRGYLQQAAAEQGWDTLGVEISPHGIKESILRGLHVLPISLDELCDKYIPYSSYFDVIVLFDFLEHISNPGRVLRTVYQILKESGVIILRIPITKACPRLHLIDHIWHFSEKTLQSLLTKERFEIISQHDSGVFESPDGYALQNVTLFARKSR